MFARLSWENGFQNNAEIPGLNIDLLWDFAGTNQRELRFPADVLYCSWLMIASPISSPSFLKAVDRAAEALVP